MPTAFISYSRHDKPFVERLHGALTARDYDVWVDWEDIPPSAEWFGEIKAGIGNADGFVYVISPDSVASEVCRRELNQALEPNKRVVPVVARDPGGAPVPEAAAALNWVFLRESDDFEAGVRMLTAALETDLDHVRIHTRVGVEASRWEQSDRDASHLLRGSDLAAAETWLATGAGKAPEATALQREFLLASRQAATRRQRTILGAVTVALAVAIVLSVVALVQRSTAIHERDTAQARLLDSEALSEYGTDPEVSVILAARAARSLPDAQTTYALRDALLHSRVRTRIVLPSPAGGDVVFSPDGRRLLVTSPRHWTRIYAAGSTRVLVSMPGPSDVGTTHWDARGDRVIVGGAEPAVYDTRTGRKLRALPPGALSTGLTPDGAIAVTSDVHAVGHVIDVASGRQLATFRSPGLHVSSCFALSPDGRTAAVGMLPSLGVIGRASQLRGTLELYDVRTGRRLRAIRALSQIETVAFSPDSREVVFTQLPSSRHGAGAAAVVRSATGLPGTLIYAVTGHGGPLHTYPGAATAAVFSPVADEAYARLAYANLGSGIASADNPTGATVHVVQLLTGRSFSLVGATDTVSTLQFDAGGGNLLATGADGTTRVYDAERDGTPIITLAGDTARVTSAAFSPDDASVATSSDDGTVRLWQGLLPTAQTNAPGQEGTASTAAFSRQGDRLLVTGGSSGPGSGRILAASNLRVLARFHAPPGQSFVGARWFVQRLPIVGLSGPRGPTGIIPTSAELYDPVTGALRATLRPTRPPFSGFALALDAAIGAGIDGAGMGDVFDTGDGRHLATLRGVTTPAADVAVSPDGRTVAIAHYPKLPASVSTATPLGPVVVQLWNGRSGRLLRTLTGPALESQALGTAEYAPLSLAFSPDGRRLALGGADQAIHVYAVDSGRPLAGLSLSGRAEGSFADSVQFSADGQYLVAGSNLGAYVWRVAGWSLLPPFAATPGPNPIVGAGFGVRAAIADDGQTLAMLVTAASTLALEMWSVPDHRQLLHVSPIAPQGASTNFSGTASIVANGGGLSIFACPLCGGLPRLLAAARTRVTRALTPAERRRFLAAG